MWARLPFVSNFILGEVIICSAMDVVGAWTAKLGSFSKGTEYVVNVRMVGLQ